MRPLCLCLVLLGVAVSVTTVSAAGPAQNQKYTTKFDNIDVDQVLKNERLFQMYYKCLLDMGRCNAEGDEIKKHVRDALESGCKKCSPKQREGAEKVLSYLYKNKHKEFEALEAKYDPKGVFRAKYRADLAKKGIKV